MQRFKQLKRGGRLLRARMVAHRYHSLQTRKGLIDELDKVTSFIVRKIYGRCVTCGTTLNLTASHFYSRRWLRVRFDLRNVTCMCMTCNERHNVNCWPYTNWFLEHYGDKVMSELFELRNSTRKVTDEDLRKLLEEHRALLRSIS